MSSRSDVLVVGAGPTGLTLACLLLQRGIDVRVVDRLPAAADVTKAMVIWSRSLEVCCNLACGREAALAREMVDDLEIIFDRACERRLAHDRMHAVYSCRKGADIWASAVTIRRWLKHLSRQCGGN